MWLSAASLDWKAFNLDFIAEIYRLMFAARPLRAWLAASRKQGAPPVLFAGRGQTFDGNQPLECLFPLSYWTLMRRESNVYEFSIKLMEEHRIEERLPAAWVFSETVYDALSSNAAHLHILYYLLS